MSTIPNVFAHAHFVLLGRPEEEDAFVLCECAIEETAQRIARRLNQTLRSSEYSDLVTANQQAWVLSGHIEVPLNELGERLPVSHVISADGEVLGEIQNGRLVLTPPPEPEPPVPDDGEPAPVEDEAHVGKEAADART